MITMKLRDVNGKHETVSATTNYSFLEFIEALNWEDYEILFISWDGYVVYSGLVGDPITFEDVIGFFA